MEQSKILAADILDILFEGRNKSYGAYELRKTYDRRIRYAIGGTMLLCMVFVVGSLLAGTKKKTSNDIVVAQLTLENVKEKEEQKVEPPKEIPKEQPPVEQVKSTVPRIVQDELVNDDDVVQDVEKLDESNHIGIANVSGENTDIVAPPVESKGIGVEPLKEKEDLDKIFPTVQIEAQYPGGKEAWRKFLERNLDNDTPSENGAPAGLYSVTISFIVDREGNLSDIKAENDPGFGTRAEAIKAITKSQKWIPAQQNGRYVMYRQRQTITFQVTDN